VKAGGEKSEYQVFVKEHFARVKKEMVGRGEDVQMGRVMEVVAREYRARKGTKGSELAVAEVGVEDVESALEGLKL
jgi:hypothetical protein